VNGESTPSPGARGCCSLACNYRIGLPGWCGRVLGRLCVGIKVTRSNMSSDHAVRFRVVSVSEEGEVDVGDFDGVGCLALR